MFYIWSSFHLLQAPELQEKEMTVRLKEDDLESVQKRMLKEIHVSCRFIVLLFTDKETTKQTNVVCLFVYR